MMRDVNVLAVVPPPLMCLGFRMFRAGVVNHLSQEEARAKERSKFSQHSQTVGRGKTRGPPSHWGQHWGQKRYFTAKK